MTEDVIAGRYRLEEQVGRTGMSEVWRATDLDLERTVALKRLGPDADPARFEREARAVATLAHPNICALYDYGADASGPFMVLEYLPGGSLEDRLAASVPLTDEETLALATAVAAGLAQAHERGVVHRDLKPSNVLFDAEGRPKIADFGIAQLGTSSELTSIGTVLGTAAYISPEQVGGREATAASDVYAFGVILFRMLTGRLPFESDDGLALAAMHRDQLPPPVSQLRPDAPPRLESLATAALAKSPSDRPQTGAALLVELRGITIAAVDGTAVTRLIRSDRRRSRSAVAVAVAAALAAAGVALAIAVTLQGGRSPAPVTTSRPATDTSPGTPAGPGTPTRVVTASPPTRATTVAETTTAAQTTTTAAVTGPVTTTESTTSPTAITSAPSPTTVPTTTAPITTAVATTAPQVDTTATGAATATDTTPTATPPATTTGTQPG